VVYPERVLQPRQNWLPDPPDGNANGIKELSPLAHIIGVNELLQIIQCDCMHTIYGGIFRRMIEAMYKKSPKRYINRGKMIANF
jgi:hypothetical protein